jgi:hypothetical protein
MNAHLSTALVALLLTYTPIGLGAQESPKAHEGHHPAAATQSVAPTPPRSPGAAPVKTVPQAVAPRVAAPSSAGPAIKPAEQPR